MLNFKTFCSVFGGGYEENAFCEEARGRFFFRARHAERLHESRPSGTNENVIKSPAL